MNHRAVFCSAAALWLAVELGATSTGWAREPPASPPATSGAGDAKPKQPVKPLPDLSVDLLELVPQPVNRQRTRVRVRVSNAGSVTSPATGVLVQCFVTEGDIVRNCRGSNPPPRFSVPRLRPGDSRTYEVPLRRFLEPSGKTLDYDIKALLDTSMRSAELDRYNNSRQLRVQF